MMYDYVEVVHPDGSLKMIDADEDTVVHKTDAGVRVLEDNQERFFPMHRVFCLVAEGDEE